MQYNQKGNTPALDGYDIVSYYTNIPKLGSPEINCIFKKESYYFSSEENKNVFLLTPERFLPQFKGLCAVSMSEGQEIMGLSSEYLVRNGKLYLFHSDQFNNLRSIWESAPPARLDSANYNWAKKKYL